LGGDQARLAWRQAQRQLAKDLGISDVTLRNWLKQERAERGERPGGLSQDEREELQQHCNTITVEGSVADATVTTLIEDSYDLVVAGLPRSERERLAQSDDR
jgi:transposase-like protein